MGWVRNVTKAGKKEGDRREGEEGVKEGGMEGKRGE